MKGGIEIQSTESERSFTKHATVGVAVGETAFGRDDG